LGQTSLQCRQKNSAPHSSHSSPESSRASGARIRAFSSASLIEKVYGRLKTLTLGSFSGDVSRFGGFVLALAMDSVAVSLITGRSGSVGGEYPAGSAQGASEGARQDAEGGEVLLELGDPYWNGLRAGVEGGEALFELGGASGEPVDLRVEVSSEGGAGATQPQTGP
jgi:hypothetical protein